MKIRMKFSSKCRIHQSTKKPSLIGISTVGTGFAEYEILLTDQYVELSPRLGDSIDHEIFNEITNHCPKKFINGYGIHYVPEKYQIKAIIVHSYIGWGIRDTPRGTNGLETPTLQSTVGTPMMGLVPGTWYLIEYNLKTPIWVYGGTILLFNDLKR